MAKEREFVTDISPEEYDELKSPFIIISPGPSGQELAGDMVYLEVEAQADIDWKTPGKSLKVPLVVTEEGINKGKSVDWYPAISGAQAMSITKRALQAFGVEEKVIVKDNELGKVKILPDHIAGAKAQARFYRELSRPQDPSKTPVLRAVLDSTSFLAIGEKPAVADLGIGS